MNWRERLHQIIFESDTKAGRNFDIALIWAIVISVALVMLDSIYEMRVDYGEILWYGEWAFTILFTVEYVLRLLSVRRPLGYAFSFFGLIDLFAILPSYLSFFFPLTQSLLVIRVFRLLRIFRVFKLGAYLGEAEILHKALRSSRPKVIVFLLTVGAIVLTMGALMYVIEGEPNGFTSIPRSIYWAIVTITTVGFGDITPKTALGQFLASCLMIVGYGIIAVPTGIVSSEIARAYGAQYTSGKACPNCGSEGHEVNAKFCKNCGSHL